MKAQHDVSLQALNTLAVPATARLFTSVNSVAELAKAIRYSQREGLPLLILGGGSNIVLGGDFDGLVIHLNLRGIDLIAEADDRIRVRVAAGENWDEFVRYSLSRHWFGLENLSAIPGSVGAAPIQNIGAYGVELGSVLESVEGYDIVGGRLRQLSHGECQLGYRDSIFKNALKDRFVITSVVLCLSTVARPECSYPALAAELGDAEPTPLVIADAVRRVRGRKLPSPAQLPNAGSFFKNPIVDQACYERLQRDYPAIPAWPVADGVKLAAGWLLEQAGWKGFRGEGPLNGLGMYHEQALVLINPGRVSGAQILALAQQVTDSVCEQFGVQLDIEPRVYC